MNVLSSFYFNAAGAMPTQAMLNLLLMRSGLRWEMHPAQLYGLEMLALEARTRFVVEKEHKAEVQRTKELFKETKYTLMGLPVVLKQDYPMSLIRLMLNGEEVTRVECLAVPAGFWNPLTYEELDKGEREKLEKIGYRSRFDTCLIPSVETQKC
jgi:hypothetical protein